MRLDVGEWAETVRLRAKSLVVTGWSVDSRTIEPGDLYFALRGPSHDGHDYVAEALRKGAAGVVTDHAIEGVENAVVVEDTLGALQSLAGWARAHWGGQVI